MPLIGLTGRAGAGKDTVCHYMQEWGRERGVEVRRAAFADRLKLSAARVFFPDIELEEAVSWCNRVKEDGTVAALDRQDDRLKQITGRVFLQRYGTEAHRQVFGDDFWIKAVIDTYTPDEILVVTDARFENEALAIRAAGGWVVRVKRDAVEVSDQHVSERGVADYLVNFEIDNNGGIVDLYSEVARFMNTEVV